jgi:hypothetical protein
MSWVVDLHPESENDIWEGYVWYERQNAGLGERFEKAVWEKVDQICINPYIFGSRTNKNLREAPIGIFPYLITYRIKKRSNQIFIVSIHHTKKHPRKKYRK